MMLEVQPTISTSAMNTTTKLRTPAVSSRTTLSRSSNNFVLSSSAAAAATTRTTTTSSSCHVIGMRFATIADRPSFLLFLLLVAMSTLSSTTNAFCPLHSQGSSNLLLANMHWLIKSNKLKTTTTTLQQQQHYQRNEQYQRRFPFGAQWQLRRTRNDFNPRHTTPTTTNARTPTTALESSKHHGDSDSGPNRQSHSQSSSNINGLPTPTVANGDVNTNVDHDLVQRLYAENRALQLALEEQEAENERLRMKMASTNLIGLETFEGEFQPPQISLPRFNNNKNQKEAEERTTMDNENVSLSFSTTAAATDNELINGNIISEVNDDTSIASTTASSKDILVATDDDYGDELWCDNTLDDGTCPIEPTISFGQALRDRAVWLVGLLILQSASGIILAHHEALLARHPVIVYFLTMLVGAGGNAGNQASVRVIRGLALGTLNDQTATQFLTRELKMALALSGILATTGFIRAAVFHTPFAETVAVTTALWLIVVSSVCLGAVLPLGLKRLGVDPAHSSTTIQVIMDILGVILAVTTASLILDTPLGQLLVQRLNVFGG